MTTTIAQTSEARSSHRLYFAVLFSLLSVVMLTSVAVGDLLVAPNSAFDIAQAGGKHSGFLKNYVGKSASEIRKGTQSLRKQIAEHTDKIANPEKHIPGFRNLDPRQQEALINRKWPGDIARQQEQLDILEGLLKSHGGGS